MTDESSFWSKTEPSGAASLRPAWLEIDLSALIRNLARLRDRAAGASVMAIVKADAYGHGAAAVAEALESAGVEWLGVALVEEGVELRRHGISTPILVLGPLQGAQLADVCEHRLVPAVSSLEQLRMWSMWAAEREDESPLSIHLKVDTGMNRLGVPKSEWSSALAAIRDDSRLRLDGLLSHLAESEALGTEALGTEALGSMRTAAQEALFEEAIALFCGDVDCSATRPWIHLANSAAALHRPSSCFNLVRAGLALYGVDPASEYRELEPVLSVKSRLVQVRTLEAGQEVGYGGQWRADRPSSIGVVPIGYADGYVWRLGNRASVLVEGRRVPVVGAVSMDMLTIDLTGTDAGLGALVTLLGRDGTEEVTAGELATLAETLPYELFCHLGLRLHRRVVETACNRSRTY